MYPYKLLAIYPWFFAFGVYMYVMGTMFRGRHLDQKQPFQTSYSAFFGGAAICSIYAVAGDVAASGKLVLLAAFQDFWFHVICIIVSVAAGYIFQAVNHGWDMKQWKKNTDKMDLVYALRLMPLLVYFFIISMVAIWSAEDVMWQGILSIVLIAIFVVTWLYDVKHGLLDQVGFLRKNPVKSVIDAYSKA